MLNCADTFIYKYHFYQGQISLVGDVAPSSAYFAVTKWRWETVQTLENAVLSINGLIIIGLLAYYQ